MPTVPNPGNSGGEDAWAPRGLGVRLPILDKSQ